MCVCHRPWGSLFFLFCGGMGREGREGCKGRTQHARRHGHAGGRVVSAQRLSLPATPSARCGLQLWLARGRRPWPDEGDDVGSGGDWTSPCTDIRSHAMRRHALSMPVPWAGHQWQQCCVRVLCVSTPAAAYLPIILLLQLTTH